MKKSLVIMLSSIVGLSVVAGIAQIALANRILPGVRLGGVAIGAEIPERARAMILERVRLVERQGITLQFDDERDGLEFRDVGAMIDVDESVTRAFALGHSGGIVQRLRDIVLVIVEGRDVPAVATINGDLLDGEVEMLVLRHSKEKKDIRIVDEQGALLLRTDTAEGKRIDGSELAQAIREAIEWFQLEPVNVRVRVDPPVIDPATAPSALAEAQRMTNDPIVLEYSGQSFGIPSDELRSWIRNEASGRTLVATIDTEALALKIAAIAQSVNVSAQEPKLVLDGNRVKEFIPPQSGITLNEEKVVKDIAATLNARSKANTDSSAPIALEATVVKPVGGDEAIGIHGIRERVGTATTTFAGSPPNRIANIKNGVKFLSGILVAPGEEFSTIKTLGAINNANGYLPELVIKQNRTVPEYGGGLCQVSTTLFRAVLATGLPVTQRQNHSYRVPYYERDGNGREIGPGLDATIYDPSPDFRFLNDTGNSLLIRGWVQGTTVTFELYGTSDGRVPSVDGPHTLSTTAAGEPIRTQTDTLPKGEVRQVERAHPGGTAVATYRVQYPDGRINEQVFKSTYRRWPAQYLVGTREEKPAEPLTDVPVPSPIN